MRLGKIKKKLEKLHGFSPGELLEEFDIKVVEHPMMDDKETDAMLITGKTRSVLYIKRNLASPYRDFLLLHEIGHRLQHFQTDAKYSYLQSQYTGRMEREANAFACLFLLQDEELEDVCINDLLESKGVPQQIAVQFVDDIRMT